MFYENRFHHQHHHHHRHRHHRCSHRHHHCRFFSYNNTGNVTVYELEAVGQFAKCCGAQPCFVELINASFWTICCGQITVEIRGRILTYAPLFQNGFANCVQAWLWPFLFSTTIVKASPPLPHFFVLIYDHHELRCQWAAAKHAGAKLKNQNLFVIFIRSGQVRPARQTAEPFQGANATCIHSTWYLVQT